MTERIDLNVGDTKAFAELTHATGDVRGGLVVVQEYWGLNDHMRSVAARFAKEGYEVLAPDLYNGKSTKDPKEALALIMAADPMKMAETIAAAADWLAKKTGKKVGAIGFCSGGAQVLAAASIDPTIAAIAPFYGLPPEGKFDLTTIKAKVIGHYAKKDDHVPLAGAHKVEAELNAAAGAGSMIVHEYDAGHAFFNDSRPEVYDAASAKLAWERTLAFFHTNIG